MASWYSRTRRFDLRRRRQWNVVDLPRTHHPRMRPCGTQPVGEQERTVLPRDAAEGFGRQAPAGSRARAAGQHLGAAGIGHGKRAVALPLVDQGLDILLVQADSLRQEWQFEFGADHVRAGLLQNGDRSFEVLHRDGRLMLLERYVAESRVRFPYNRRIVSCLRRSPVGTGARPPRNRRGRLRSAPRSARCSRACARWPRSSAGWLPD